MLGYPPSQDPLVQICSLCVFYVLFPLRTISTCLEIDALQPKAVNVSKITFEFID
jgi:hypothetical protein